MSTFIDNDGKALDISKVKNLLFPCRFKPDKLAMPVKKPRRKPDKIPKPMNTFILFRRALNIVRSENKWSSNGRDVSLIASDIWNAATDDEKSGYERIAKELEIKHKEDYPGFKEERKSKRKHEHRFKNFSPEDMKSGDNASPADVKLPPVTPINMGPNTASLPVFNTVNQQAFNSSSHLVNLQALNLVNPQAFNPNSQPFNHNPQAFNPFNPQAFTRNEDMLNNTYINCYHQMSYCDSSSSSPAPQQIDYDIIQGERSIYDYQLLYDLFLMNFTCQQQQHP